MKARIALCQLNPISGKPKDNFETIQRILKKYARKNIALFIFPEDFLNGILRQRKEILTAGRNFDFWAKRFSSLAKEHNVDIVPGSFPLFKDGKLFNSAVHINKKGEILNQYSKTNLWLSEREEYAANSLAPKCFESPLGKTMLIICWDLMSHKLFEEAVKQKVEWIIIISLWSVNQSRDLAIKRGITKNKYHIPISRSERLISIIEAKSAEYNMGIIFCNIGGTHRYLGQDKKEQEARSAGHTQIIAPLDGVRKMVKNRKEQVLICDVPEIKDFISDHEILYGRREDICNNY